MREARTRGEVQTVEEGAVCASVVRVRRGVEEQKQVDFQRSTAGSRPDAKRKRKPGTARAHELGLR